MKPETKLQAQVPALEFDILQKVLCLPENLLKHHDLHGLSQLVLSHISDASCFNLKKAVFLVDNPDFNRISGMAAHCNSEQAFKAQSLWSEPGKFLKQVSSTTFYQQVKNLEQASLQCHKADLNNPACVAEISQKLNLEKAKSFCWNLKHNNHGILLYEPEFPEKFEKHSWLFSKVAAFLSMCGF